MERKKISKKIVVGNWKMNPLTLKEAEKLLTQIVKQDIFSSKVEVVVCPPVLYFNNLKKITKKISLGAQDAFYEEKGAYTGEVSVEMLANMGVKYVILGHSERRAAGETNQTINKKIKATLSSGLTPILCVGEKERDENHEYLNLIKIQVEECLSGISKNSVSKIIIAYEPVWAIGKGAAREATSEEYREMSVFIRKILSDKFGAKMLEGMRTIYGGSVHPENAESFLKEGGADGFLVGRDSLDPKKFGEIINISAKSI